MSAPAVLRRHVVACVLEHGRQFLLLRRSSAVDSDPGLWHCVTGYCDDDAEPLEQAHREVEEETGLSRGAVQLVRAGAPLVLLGDDGVEWTIHAFLFTVAHPFIRLNWENDAVRWVEVSSLHEVETVPWFSDVQSRLGLSA